MDKALNVFQLNDKVALVTGAAGGSIGLIYTLNPSQGTVDARIREVTNQNGIDMVM